MLFIELLQGNKECYTHGCYENINSTATDVVVTIIITLISTIHIHLLVT
jgi:hypothetical protein